MDVEAVEPTIVAVESEVKVLEIVVVDAVAAEVVHAEVVVLVEVVEVGEDVGEAEAEDVGVGEEIETVNNLTLDFMATKTNRMLTRRMRRTRGWNGIIIPERIENFHFLVCLE